MKRQIPCLPFRVAVRDRYRNCDVVVPRLARGVGRHRTNGRPGPNERLDQATPRIRHLGPAIALFCATSLAAIQIPVTNKQVVASAFDGAASVGVGDLDGDGDLDLLGAAELDSEISWWENEAGDGTVWTRHGISSIVTGAEVVRSADLDGDGDLDVVAASSALAAVGWWENTAGDASAWSIRSLDTAAAGIADLEVADVDGDGDLDLVEALAGAGALRWLENTAGDGSAWATHVVDASFLDASSVRVEDVNEDGQLDVLGATQSGDEIAWWSNTVGDGSAWTKTSIDASFVGAQALSSGDFDEDGDVDVFGGAATDSASWWENTSGDGSAWTRRTVQAGTSGISSLEAFDLDGDGDVDVLVAQATASRLFWYENLEGTSFSFRSLAFSLGDPRSATAADLDGDGDLDVVGATYLSDQIFWLGNRTLHRSALYGPAEETVDDTSLSTLLSLPGDIDGDGRLDVVTSSQTPGLSWWERDPMAGTWQETTIEAGLSIVRLGDIDGDGDLDAAGFDDSLAKWYRNELGDGSVWSALTIDGILFFGGSPALGDVDGDGDLDLIAQAGSITEETVWWENSAGDGSTWSSRQHIAAPSQATALTLGDIDGDGDLDVAGSGLSSGTNPVTWYGNANGDGSSWATTVVDSTANRSVRTLGSGDLDEDGDLDLFGATTAELFWWENSAGDGTAWSAHEIPLPPDFPFGILFASQIESADLDRDGDIDLVVSMAANDAIDVWVNLGGASAWEWRPGPSFEDASSFSVGDLDGDGGLDLLASSSSGSRVAWWKDVGGQFALPTLGTSPPTAVEGDAIALMLVQASHLGRSGDEDVQLASFDLLFEAAPGYPLTTGEANGLMASLEVYLDDGSGVFDSPDILVSSVPTLQLDSGGVQSIALPGQSTTQLGFGVDRFYHLVATLEVTAGSALPSAFEVTHLTSDGGSAAEHSGEPGISLDIEFSIGSSVPVDVLACSALAMSHIGNGTDPSAHPAGGSAECVGGEFLEGVAIEVMATPDPGWVMSGWEGTIDDTSTSTTNSVIMPAAGHSVTAHYVLALFADGFESGDLSRWSSSVP